MARPGQLIPKRTAWPPTSYKRSRSITRATWWFGTSMKGVSRFDGKKWTTFSQEKEGLLSDFLFTSVADDQGGVWFGTSNGASYFDGTARRDYTTADGLISNNVRAITVDPSGAVWFGTGAGISVFDGKTWQSYTAVDGLVFDQVRSASACEDGAVWFATFAGASRFTGQAK